MAHTLIWLLLTCLCVQGAPIQRRGAATDVLATVKGTLFFGVATYYDVGPGSCGHTNKNNELVVALNKAQMNNGINPNANPRCHQKVHVQGTNGSTVLRVVDTCPGCARGKKLLLDR
ncbi:hypothetical protein DFQ29_000109 [Apophysomyces sp. BC1021]|nr:hypothetical protein DFQ29_000109 [Apophysomyces sp. BC1021]